MSRFPIRRKLIVAFILVGVIPMLIATYAGVQIASGRLGKGIEERINYAGKSAVYLLARKKTELEGVARSMSGDARLRQAMQGGVNIKFLWFDTPLKVFLFDNEGGTIFSNTGAKLSRPKSPVQGMTLLRTDGAYDLWPLLVYVLPVTDQDRPIGTIMTGYSLNHEFLNDLQSVTGVESILFRQDSAGAYISIGTEGKLELDEGVFKKVVTQSHQAFTKNAAIVRDGERSEYNALLTPLPDAAGRVSFILANGIPTSETLSGKLASARFYYILIVLGLLLSVVVGSAVATGISWPILRFSEGVRAISAGDYSQKIHVRSRDEIGELAESFNRMTDRLQETVAQLIENQNYTENILRSLINGVITIDPEFRIMRVNRAAESILDGSSEALLGREISDVLAQNSELLRLIRDSMRHHRRQEGIETVLHRADGSTVPVELSLSILEDPMHPSGSGTGLVILLRDLTEIQALKEHIRRQDRLAALGELSAGIAHEIRNPLGIIKGAAGILRKESDQRNPRLEELSGVISEEVDRLNDVITDFLEFARPKPPQFKRHNMNDLIRGTLQMASLQIEQQKIEVHSHLASNLPEVMADEHQLHEMFLNLLLNALQSTEDGDSIEISSRHLADEGQIEIVFSDTGMGIPAKHLKKVFNPFFTTKKQGTGLGLSVVSKIVENHHGKIFLASLQGQGAKFTIRIPAAEKFEDALPNTVAGS